MSDLAKNDEEDFIFIFNDGRISKYTQNEILEVSPSFYYKSINNITFNKIKVPPSITKEDISSFIDVYKKGVISFNNNNSNNYMNFLEENIKILKFLQISEFFENDSFSLILINDYFIKGSKITNENALTLLKISYKKLNDLNKEGYLENYSENLDSAWFDLFMKCLDIIGCNLVNYFKDKEENFENNELSFFEKKIIDEIFEKFAKNLIINNYEIIEDDENINKNEDNNNNENNNDNKKYISISDLEHIIKFLSMNRKQNNFFDLLTNEYMKICSEENINEINNLPNPTFLLKLNVNEIETYYEEFKIENQIDSKNERKITFVVFYRKTDDSLNIGFKLSQDKNNNNNNNNENNNNNNNKLNSFDEDFLSFFEDDDKSYKERLEEVHKLFNFDDGGIISENGNEIIFLGIIDILTEYNCKKSTEHFFKMLRYCSNDMSCVNPIYYKDRFFNYMKKVIEHGDPNIKNRFNKLYYQETTTDNDIKNQFISNDINCNNNVKENEVDIFE